MESGSAGHVQLDINASTVYLFTRFIEFWEVRETTVPKLQK
jgi:hypothetical protein